MKKTALILIFALILSALPFTVSATAESLELSGAQITASAGDTVDVAITIDTNPGFAFLNLYYVLDEGLILNSVTNKVSAMGFLHDATSSWDNSVDYNATGDLAVLKVTLADDIAPGTYEIKIINIEAYNENLDDVMVTANSALITVESKVMLSDNITVLESNVKYTANAAGEGVEALISYTKGEAVLDLLYADAVTGALKFMNASGAYETLYDKEGTPIVLSADTATELAVIYDDINGTVRYYVNENVPYYGAAENRVLANNIAVNADFVGADGAEKIDVLENALSNVKVYNIHDSGTAEVLAFQDHTEESHIRILSGVDMPWYMAIGYEIEVFANGVGQGAKAVETDIIFSSVVANGTNVYATDYGYNYFSVLEIDYVDTSDNREYYVIINPFTRVGTAKYYGDAAKIDIDANGGYSFDENY